MQKSNKILLRLFIILIVYLIIKYFVPQGRLVMYPINLFVTYLHEFGHALGALFTGGEVASLAVNENGSGVCYTRGGNAPIILMGGYIGSAILGNMLLFIGARFPKLARFAMILLSISLGFSAFYWYSQPFTSGVLVAFAALFIVIAAFTKWSGNALMFLGIASVAFIIEDFNIGPSSDLQKYTEIFVMFPQEFWMYTWLIIVLVLTFFNIRWILKSGFKETEAAFARKAQPQPKQIENKNPFDSDIFRDN